MNCAICQDDLPAACDEKAACTLNCGHRFHGKCIWRWVFSQPKDKRQCPVCREPVRSCQHFADGTSTADFLEAEDNIPDDNISAVLPSCWDASLLIVAVRQLLQNEISIARQLQEQQDMVMSLRLAHNFHVHDQNQMILSLQHWRNVSHNRTQTELNNDVPSTGSRNGSHDHGNRVRSRSRSRSPVTSSRSLEYQRSIRRIRRRTGTYHSPSVIPESPTDVSGTATAGRGRVPESSEQPPIPRPPSEANRSRFASVFRDAVTFPLFVQLSSSDEMSEDNNESSGHVRITDAATTDVSGSDVSSGSGSTLTSSLRRISDMFNPDRTSSNSETDHQTNV